MPEEKDRLELNIVILYIMFAILCHGINVEMLQNFIQTNRIKVLKILVYLFPLDTVVPFRLFSVLIQQIF